MELKDLGKSDADLRRMLFEKLKHEPVEWTPVVLAELTRREIGRLKKVSRSLAVSSRRLEKLTCLLLWLTVVLAALALPPAIEAISKIIQALFLRQPY